MKQLSELTLMDKFLFDQTMDIPEAHEAALQIILGQEKLRLLTPSQTEKELRTAPWLRSIRLDVYALDQEGTVYNTEMQAERRNDLAKRSRYYQSLIDSSLLSPGISNFNKLKDTCIIMITPFDLFGKDRYCYTFHPYCRESENLCLNDGTVRIFLNTKGKNDDEVRPELIDFLHYLETADGELAAKSSCKQLQQIHSCVARIKSSEEFGVKYMQTWEEKIIIREQGIEEGIQTTTIASIKSLMSKLQMTAEQAMDALSVPEENREKYMNLLD